ncbi:hypothetical protein PRBEI_2001892000 [Prionailurus iriomotensis]
MALRWPPESPHSSQVACPCPAAPAESEKVSRRPGALLQRDPGSTERLGVKGCMVGVLSRGLEDVNWPGRRSRPPLQSLRQSARPCAIVPLPRRYPRWHWLCFVAGAGGWA